MGSEHWVRRTNKTEYERHFTEKEVEEILSEALASKAGVDMTTVTKTRLIAINKDSVGSGPYREYQVTLTVDYGGGDVTTD